MFAMCIVVNLLILWLLALICLMCCDPLLAKMLTAERISSSYCCLAMTWVYPAGIVRFYITTSAATVIAGGHSYTYDHSSMPDTLCFAWQCFIIDI